MLERLRFEREIALLDPGRSFAPEPERETAEGLRRKLQHLSLLPHRLEQGGKDVALTAGAMDPGIYDGPVKYRIAETLQKCLNAAIGRQFAHVKVALVDLTKGAASPEFAGFNHKSQVFIASVAKIFAMFGAFQLRHDLRTALDQKKPKTLAELFAAMRDDWAATQKDPGGKATPFAGSLQLRGKLALAGGKKIALADPKGPRLEEVFAPVAAGDPPAIEFSSTGEAFSALQSIVKEYNGASAVHGAAKQRAEQALEAARQAEKKKDDAARLEDARKKLSTTGKALASARAKLDEAARKIQALGFRERLGIAVGGDVPASNFATFTVVGDTGYLYIASTHLQSGLHDPNRGGGLWLGARYGGKAWRGGLTGGDPRSATAGALAAFMTLLVQGALVSPQASAEMRAFMEKRPNLTFPGTGSWFDEGLSAQPPKTLLAKVGLANGVDEVAFIERDVETTADDGSKKTTTIRYVVVALRARNGDELHTIIRDLDKCILANNGLNA